MVTVFTWLRNVRWLPTLAVGCILTGTALAAFHVEAGYAVLLASIALAVLAREERS